MNLTSLDIAREYLQRGWAPLPLAPRTKNPGFADWQNFRASEDELDHHFNGRPRNIGVLLGAPSGGLADVDCDSREAVALAPVFLPHTGTTFGRASKPRSHWLYLPDLTDHKTIKFLDVRDTDGPGGKKTRPTIVELRGTGGQTVFPGSTHEGTGEPIEFNDDAGPARVAYDDLRHHVGKLAAAAILAKYWPGEGSRHHAANALAGGLLRAEWNADEATTFLVNVARVGGDDEYAERGKLVPITAQKIAKDERVTGWRTLAELIGKDVVGAAREWLGMKSGTGAEDSTEFVLDPANPLETAKRFRVAEFSHTDGPTLHHAGDVFQLWNGRAYEELEANALRAEVYRYCEPAKKWVLRGEQWILQPFKPADTAVNKIIDALKAASYQKAVAPAWLVNAKDLPEPLEIIPARNGLVHLTAPGGPRIIRPPTPLFFSRNALEYDYAADAPEPVQWLRFLDALWPDDHESIGLLQEWFGYCLTLDTKHHKMLLIIGPTRSGKGTIARILTATIGKENVRGPTLSGLATNFGLWPLIDKQLAIVTDARLSGRTDQAIVTERLLAISGDDMLTFDRKNMKPWTGKLPTRIMILSNELPKLADASGALANRFLILTLETSYLGREDTALTARLMTERPGILHWAIEGWRRLSLRGHFIQPTTGSESVQEMMDLASPVKAFVREWCKEGNALEVPRADLYEAFVLWAREQGTPKPAENHVFARDLRAAVPGISSYQPKKDEARYRAYRGIDLTLSAKETLSVCRNSKRDKDRQ